MMSDSESQPDSNSRGFKQQQQLKRKRPGDHPLQPKQKPRPKNPMLVKHYADTESYITNMHVQAFALSHILRQTRGKYDEPPRCIGQTHLALITDIEPLSMMKKPNRQQMFDTSHHSNLVHALQRSLYSTPLLLHSANELTPLSLDQLVLRNRLVSLSFCALRDFWPEQFLHPSSFISNQRASMMSREQSSLLLVSLESKNASPRDKASVDDLFQCKSLQQLIDDPLRSDTSVKLRSAYAPSMLQHPAPVHNGKSLHPHKSCFMRVDSSSAYAPSVQTAATMTDSEIDRHCAAAAAMRLISILQGKQLACTDNTDLINDEPRCNSLQPDKRYAHLYNVVPQILLLVSDTNQEMLSVFSQVYASARLPLGAVLYSDERRIECVGPALDSTLVQRAALDRLPCFADPHASASVHEQRGRISRITQHSSSKLLHLHEQTRVMLHEHKALQRENHNMIAEHENLTVSQEQYDLEFKQYLSQMLEPEVRNLDAIIRDCNAESDQRYCITGAPNSKRLMHQASLDALDTWRRAFILPQRHDMYHSYMDSQQFALRLASVREAFEHSPYCNAWSREIARSFKSVLLAMPHLLGRAASLCDEDRLKNWWFKADRTAHYIDHISHRNEENKVRDLTGLPPFNLITVFNKYDSTTPAAQVVSQAMRVANELSNNPLAMCADERQSLCNTPSDSKLQQYQSPLQALAEHADAELMLIHSTNAGATSRPPESPSELNLSNDLQHTNSNSLPNVFGADYTPIPALPDSNAIAALSTPDLSTTAKLSDVVQTMLAYSQSPDTSLFPASPTLPLSSVLSEFHPK